MSKDIYFKGFSEEGTKKWEKPGRKLSKLWHIIFI